MLKNAICVHSLCWIALPVACACAMRYNRATERIVMRMTRGAGARLRMIAAMLIFGSVGIFVRSIPLPSQVIALVRGLVGCGCLLGVMAARRVTVDWPAIRKNAKWLALSGAAIGINWILLFEAYRYTTVATATLCYYLAPVLVMLASPFWLGEKLTGKRIACAACALAGMVLVSGVATGGADGDMRGVLLGLGAACFYASVVLLNKRLAGIGAYDMTAAQLGLAAVVILPYVLLTTDASVFSAVDAGSWAMLVLVGVVHTGAAYCMYFSAVRDLHAQTAAILSYIDPVSAILMAGLFLGEAATVTELIGAALVLGSTLLSEVSVGKKRG